MTLKGYDSKEMIEGKTGAKFYMKGPEIAAIEITSVSPERAEGRIVSGSLADTDVCLKK